MGIPLSARRAGFPKLAIKSCLESQNLKISDIDHIAINSSSKSKHWACALSPFSNKNLT